MVATCMLADAKTDIKIGSIETSDGQDIAYAHYGNGSDKVIIIVHGFYNSKDSVLIKRLVTKLSDKYDVFTFDLRGHGDSSGLFTWTSDEDKDLKAVLDFLAGKYDKEAIVAFSYGGSISINVLAEDGYDVDSLVCVSAPSDPDKIDCKWWKLDFENDISYSLLNEEGREGKGVRPGPFWMKKEKPIDNIGKLSMPVLYIHGDKDWVVDEWHSRALYEKTKGKKDLVIIDGGFHAEYLMRQDDDLFVGTIKEWLENTL